MNSWLLIALSFVLILAGFLVPFLMVLGVLEAGFTLSFSAYFCSLVGLVLALHGRLTTSIRAAAMISDLPAQTPY